jgi:internalin A
LQPFLSSVASAAPQPKSFEAWCRQKNSVLVETRHTIDVLLKKAGTKNCKLADRQLKTLTHLDLIWKKIVDVKLLAGLTNLTYLVLTGNKIVDVKPLASLTNLIILNLTGNKIIDVNQIGDVQPLPSGFESIDFNRCLV